VGSSVLLGDLCIQKAVKMKSKDACAFIIVDMMVERLHYLFILLELVQND